MDRDLAVIGEQDREVRVRVISVPAVSRCDQYVVLPIDSVLHAQWEKLYYAHLFMEADGMREYSEADCGDDEACSCFTLLLRLRLRVLMIGSKESKEASRIYEGL